MKMIQVAFLVDDQTDVNQWGLSIGEIYLGNAEDEHVKYVLDHVKQVVAFREVNMYK